MMRGPDLLQLFFLLWALATFTGCTADDYYSSIDPTATNNDLKTQLKALINPHVVIAYDDAWIAFADLDRYTPFYPCDTNSTHIPDVYSSYCWSQEKVTPGGECGNYAKEGDCFNREHIWPKSWFGGFDYGANAQTDLFELWPSDGYVNGLRANLPLGPVLADSVTYTSTNGCKIGKCNTNSADYSGNCFEPADSFKGCVFISPLLFVKFYFYLFYFYFYFYFFFYFTVCILATGTSPGHIFIYQ